MASKYNEYNDKDFIRALNTGVKLEYDVEYSTLLNNVMFITAQVINKSLKMDIFNYEKDAFSHNFFLESGVNTFVEGMFNEDYPEMNSVKEIEEIAINRLQKMQDYLKNLCKEIIQSKEDLILESKYITAPLLYDLYNNGNCLPQEYTNIKDKVLNYLGIDLNNLTDEMIYDINNNLVYIIYNFGIPEISTYLNAFSNSNSRNIYKFKFGNYNLFDLLFNNLDLMAKHLIGHCLLLINNIRLKNNNIINNLTTQQNIIPIPVNSNYSQESTPIQLVTPIADQNMFNQLFTQPQVPQQNNINPTQLVYDINNALYNVLGGAS